MAQRVAKFARKSPGHRRAEGPERPAVAMRAIALDVAPLLAPYKKRGRLALRVERVPQQARLSQGRNNGDGSWSIALDELDALQYQYPESIDGLEPLAIRIIGLDHEASTLAVLNYPLASEPVILQSDTKPPPEDSQLRRLRVELNQVKADLAAREGELIKVRSVPQPPPRAAIESELTLARAAWQAETEKLLAEAHSHEATMLAQYQTEARSEREAHLAEAQSRASQSLAQAHSAWQQKIADAIANAAIQWQDAETHRLAVAQAQWETASASALAQLRSDLETTRSADLDGKVQSLRQRLYEAEAVISARETALSDALASATASNAALVALRTEVEATRSAKNDGQVRSLRERLTELESTLSAREAAFCEVQADAEAERARAAAELDAVRARFNESDRLDLLNADWRSRYDRDIGELQARLDISETALAEARNEAPTPFKGRLASTEAALAESTSALAQLRSLSGEALDTAQREWDQKLANAKMAWRADEATHLATAHALWREQSADALKKATSRYEAAEVALTQLRKESRKARTSRGDDDSNRLREDYATLQAKLEEREAELEYARSTIEARNIQSPANVSLGSFDASSLRQQENAIVARRLLFDGGVIVLFIVLAIWFYPRVAPLLPDSWQATMAANGIGSTAPPQISVKPQAPPKLMMIGHGGFLRTTPSPSASVLIAAPKGASITLLEERGKWSRVRLAARPHAIDGWIRSSSLKHADARSQEHAERPDP